MGDWLIVGTVRLVAPQRLSIRQMTLQLIDSTVDVDDVEVSNKVIPNLGLVYAVLRKDYVSGTPGGSGALDSMYLDEITTTSRSTVSALYTTPGNYSIIVANNTKAVSGVTIPTTTSIDFTVMVNGAFRLELIGG
jgi:hypothetical protein